MNRSTSLESVLSVRPPLPDTPPPELPKNSERRYSHEVPASTSRAFSLSPLRVLSPSSVVAFDFSFLEESPINRVTPSLSHEHYHGASRLTECLKYSSDRRRVMSESVVTSISPNVPDAGHDVRIPSFSSMQSLNSASDGVDGTHSCDSFDPVAHEERVPSSHASDPMIATLGRRIYSLEDLKTLAMKHRSFSADDTSCDKENQFELSAAEKDVSPKEIDDNDSTERSDAVDFAVNGASSDTNSCEDTDITDRTILAEKEISGSLDTLAAVITREEEIRRIEEAAYALTDGVELPRSSEPAVTLSIDDNSGSSDHLLDESMIPLVGTPHPMTYIPMEEVFTFADRRANQELPAITEENEEQTLRRHRGSGEPPLERLTRAGSLDVPREPEELAPGYNAEEMEPMEPNMVIEYDYPYAAEYVHRRALSDNVGLQGAERAELRRTQEMEEIDRAGMYEDIAMRPSRSVLRTNSSVSNRCQSQVFLPDVGLSETAKSAPALDRNLSSSDPSINEEKPTKARECPPPVVLTRKASTMQSEWKKQHSAGSLSQAAPVQMRKEPVGRESRPQSMTRGERSTDRIEKKKTKSGSDTFSFGNLFGTRGKKKGVDRSLEAVLSSFQSKPIGNAVSLPARRMPSSELGQTRLPIPDFEGLPDHLSALSQTNDINDVETVSLDSTEAAKYNLNSPLWDRFDLFSKEEYTSWHDKFRHDKMSSKMVKKQDAIFELILIEKAHCAHLAFLQQGYRNRLIQENILPESDVNRLIPDVLDALLVFHLHLLDRLTARQRESDEVETISDILAEEMSDEGKHVSIAINAYTTFGSAKEKSEKMFESLMAKNGRFADFIRSTSREPLYRRFEFKSTMTRVISRPAKYGLLIETILKNEGNKFTKECELTQKALLAAKRFAMKIDNNLLMAQMAQRWDSVRSHFDHSSHTNLYLVDKEKPSGVVRITFTMEDLDMDMKQVGSGQRRLMCLGDVNMKNSTTKLVEKVFMVLFDDILVCLQRRNNQKYVFIQQEQSVFPVSGLILRPADRSASVMIISGAITKPALLEVEFNSKTDRTKWIKTLETAIHSAPVKVRLSPRNEDEAARQLEQERQLQLKRQKEAEDMWLRKLDEMFEQRNSQERVIQDYMLSLMKFFDELRVHLHSLPLKSRPDVADRIREAVRQHCRELRLSRTAPLNRLIENACVARESELWSFIDVASEIALNGTPDSDGGGSSSDSSGSGRRPRRIHTFHGTTAPSSAHSPSTSGKEKSSIRRHTTVPRMSVSQDSAPDRTDEEEDRVELNEERREQLEVDEKTHRLPLGLNLKARRAMTNLIRDVVKLKTENNHLRNEISLSKTRLAMKDRTQHTMPACVLASDTMEALRRKEQEVREEDARRRRELEQWAEQLREQQKQQQEEAEQLLLEKERLQRSEAELADKWAALHAASVGGTPNSRIIGRISMKSPNAVERVSSFRDQKVMTSHQGISPALRNLTKKSETKRVKK